MGLDRSTWLEERHGVTVTWMPYDLHPEIPEGGLDAERAYRRLPSEHRQAYVAHLKSLCDEVGLPFDPPGHIPNTRPALEASEWVRRHDPAAFPAFHRALFHAHWAQGRDLEDRVVLADLARSAGTDADVVVDAVERRLAQHHVDESTETGIRMGITGTPAWLIDGRLLIPGAQERDVFDRVIERMREKRPRGEDASGRPN